MNPLEWPIFAHTRRNHALEHATINLLSRQHASLRLVGRSDWSGFTLYGTVSTEDVQAAVSGALQRLHEGEHELALHTACGTNYATGVVLASLASYAALQGKRRSALQKMVQLLLGLVAALTLAQPVGLWLQEHATTSPDLANLRVTAIRRLERGKLVVHRIETAQG